MQTDTQQAVDRARLVARAAVACGLLDHATATRALQEYIVYVEQGTRGTLVQLLLARQMIDEAGAARLQQQLGGPPTTPPAQMPSSVHSSMASDEWSQYPGVGPPAAPPQTRSSTMTGEWSQLPAPPAPRGAYDPDEASTIQHGDVIVPPGEAAEDAGSMTLMDVELPVLLPPSEAPAERKKDDAGTTRFCAVIPQPDPGSDSAPIPLPEDHAEMTMVDMAIPVLRPPGAPDVDTFDPEQTGTLDAPGNLAPPPGLRRPTGALAEATANDDITIPDLDPKVVAVARRRLSTPTAAAPTRGSDSTPELSAARAPKSAPKGPMAVAVLAVVSVLFAVWSMSEEPPPIRSRPHINAGNDVDDPGLTPEVASGGELADATAASPKVGGQPLANVARPTFVTQTPSPTRRFRPRPAPVRRAPAKGTIVPVTQAIPPAFLIRFRQYMRVVEDHLRLGLFREAIDAEKALLTDAMREDPQVLEQLNVVRGKIDLAYYGRKKEHNEQFDGLLRTRRFRLAWTALTECKNWSIEDDLPGKWRKRFETVRGKFLAEAKKLKGSERVNGRQIEVRLRKVLRGWGSGTSRVYDTGAVVLSYEGNSEALAKDMGARGTAAADDTTGWVVKAGDEYPFVLLHPLPLARVLDVTIELILIHPPSKDAEIALLAGVTGRPTKGSDVMGFGVAWGTVPVKLTFPETLVRLTKDTLRDAPIQTPIRLRLAVSEKGNFQGSMTQLGDARSTKVRSGQASRVKGIRGSKGQVGLFLRGVDVAIRSMEIRGMLDVDRVLGKRRKRPPKSRRRSGKRDKKKKAGDK